MFAFCSSDDRTELGSRVDGTFGQVVIKCELACYRQQSFPVL